jgi:hypothetical protein
MKGSRFLFPALFKALVLPPLVVYVLLHILPRLAFPTPTCLSLVPPLLFPLGPGLLGRVLRISAYLISFPAVFILRSTISARTSSWAAKKLGAHIIPRVEGRWVLNVDILQDWARSGSDDEVGRMMVDLGRRYGGTYNTRVLGEDQVSRVWGFWIVEGEGRGARGCLNEVPKLVTPGCWPLVAVRESLCKGESDGEGNRRAGQTAASGRWAGRRRVKV